MKEQGFLLRFLRSILLIDVAVLVVVGLACWLGGRRTAYDYGGGLTLAGMGLVGLGVVFVVYGWRASRSFTQVYGESMSEDSMRERTERRLVDALRTYGLLIRLTAAGVVLVALGAIIQTVTR